MASRAGLHGPDEFLDQGTGGQRDQTEFFTGQIFHQRLYFSGSLSFLGQN
jgi:hypothetical protein